VGNDLILAETTGNGWYLKGEVVDLKRRKWKLITLKAKGTKAAERVEGRQDLRGLSSRKKWENGILSRVIKEG